MVLISIIPTYKMRYCKLKISFWFTKKHFFKIRKFFEDKMRVRSKFFPHFLEEIEKFKLSLSKQHNKMLKMISEMRKNQKKSVAIKLGKFSRKKIPRNFPNPGNPKDFRNLRNFPGFLGRFLKISRFPGSLKSGKKENFSCNAVTTIVWLDTFTIVSKVRW